MAITLLYDSEEWSNHHLAKLLQASGLRVTIINLENQSVPFNLLFNSRLVINRVFPSALLREHTTSAGSVHSLLKNLHHSKVPILNSYPSFLYDFSKSRSNLALSRAGLPVPEIYSIFTRPGSPIDQEINFPLVMKPDCGGRSKFTYIINETSEFQQILKKIPKIPFILQKYICPDLKYTTRIEIIDNQIISIMKRYTGHDSISSYHAGSKYLAYPDCPSAVRKAALRALLILDTGMGSLDIIEQKSKDFFIIDTNSTSNFTPDYLELMGFDPIRKMADFIINYYQKLP